MIGIRAMPIHNSYPIMSGFIRKDTRLTVASEPCNSLKSVLKAVDLFSGCGGLTQGLVNAAFDVVGAVEISKLAVKTYRLNHPNVRVWSQDIRDLNAEDLRKTLHLRLGTLDLLAGCPPCQGYSAMRTLNGSVVVEDLRNDLVFEFVRFVRALLPRVIMMENVPALATDNRMARVMDELKQLGYIGKVHVLDAAEYGVPQRRRRMILIAGRGKEVNLGQFCGPLPTVRTAISGLSAAGISGDILHDLPEQRSAKVMEIINAVPRDGGSRSSIDKRLLLPCHDRCNGFRDVYGRMAWDAPAPTITSGCNNPSKGRFIHPEFNRAITLREAALLQSFPVDYAFALDKGKQGVAEMIGNALPPIFIQCHAMAIADSLNKKSSLFQQKRQK